MQLKRDRDQKPDKDDNAARTDHDTLLEGCHAVTPSVLSAC